MTAGLRPVARPELLRRLRRLGFEGPFSGGRHQFVVRGNVTLRLPNPHRSDVGVELLARILRQAGIGRREWDSSRARRGRDDAGPSQAREPRVRYRKTRRPKTRKTARKRPK